MSDKQFQELKELLTEILSKVEEERNMQKTLPLLLPPKIKKVI